jgi:hypothetical protein
MLSVAGLPVDHEATYSTIGSSPRAAATSPAVARPWSSRGAVLAFLALDPRRSCWNVAQALQELGDQLGRELGALAGDVAQARPR